MLRDRIAKVDAGAYGGGFIYSNGLDRAAEELTEVVGEKIHPEHIERGLPAEISDAVETMMNLRREDLLGGITLEMVRESLRHPDVTSISLGQFVENALETLKIEDEESLVGFYSRHQERIFDSLLRFYIKPHGDIDDMQRRLSNAYAVDLTRGEIRKKGKELFATREHPPGGVRSWLRDEDYRGLAIIPAQVNPLETGVTHQPHLWRSISYWLTAETTRGESTKLIETPSGEQVSVTKKELGGELRYFDPESERLLIRHRDGSWKPPKQYIALPWGIREI